jgi:preprotein translocase subunit SecG
MAFSLKNLPLKQALVVGLILLPLIAEAATSNTTGFTSLEDTSNGAKGAIVGLLKTITWLVAFFPVAVAGFFAFKMKEHIENKEENNQNEPKWIKNGKIISAFAGGVLIAYIIVGIFGSVFMDANMNDSWKSLVTDFWKQLIVASSDVAAKR